MFPWHSSRVHWLASRKFLSLFYSLWRNSRILSLLKLKQNVRRTSLNCRIGVDERASWASWAPGELSRPAAKERPAPTCQVHTKSAPSIFPSAWRPSIAHPLPIHFHLIHSNTIHSTIMAQKHLKMQHLCKQLEGWKSKSLSKRKIFWHSLGRFESCGAGWCCNGAGFDVLKLLPDWTWWGAVLAY